MVPRREPHYNVYQIHHALSFARREFMIDAQVSAIWRFLT
jgi:hypothetical protein